MIIRLADVIARPWKNGLGSTREIAVQPSTASSDDFLWRVSIAEVDSAAPFSSFPGIDRHIVLLNGSGFTMTLDGQRTHALTTPFVPFAFPGEAKVEVTLAGGPTRDFNLMVRRRQARGDVQVVRTPGQHQLDPNSELVYCACGTIDTAEGRLHGADSWLPGERDFTLSADAVAFIVRIT